jgi:hypothetical protein
MAFALSLAGCGGTTFDTLERKIKNPFSKKEVPLPGERIAIITDPTTVVADPAEAARPVQLPAPQANASGRSRAARRRTASVISR